MWSWVKRHKKKLAAGVVIGAGLYAYRWYRQSRDKLESFVNELEKNPLFAALLNDTDAKKTHFAKAQSVSDEQVALLLGPLHGTLSASFDPEAIQAQLKARTGDRETLFCALQQEYCAQLVASLISANLLILLHRIVSIMVARQDPEQGSTDDLYAFFSASRYIVDGGGKLVATRSREAVQKQWASKGLTAVSGVPSAELASLLWEASNDVLSQPLVDVLLGDNLVLGRDAAEKQEKAAWSPRVEALVAECRDVVDAPQFRQVAELRVRDATARASQALVPEGPQKLAKLCRPMKLSAEAALGPDSDEVNVAASAADVADLCEAVFFDVE